MTIKITPATCILTIIFVSAFFFSSCGEQSELNSGNESLKVSGNSENSRSLKVQTYTSPAGDAVNSHWIETEEGVIVIDTQRLLPEAEKALAEIKKTNKPILGVFITHPHTDHYGGLSVFAESLPSETPIFAAAKTVESMKNDNRGFNKARRERHGEAFPAQETINRFLPNRIIKDGEKIELGGVEFEIIEKPINESETSILIYLPKHEILFTGDLVNNKVTPAPFESIENWIRQLDEIKEQFPNVKTVYLGHGAAGEAKPLIAEQLEYLKLLRDLVKIEIENNGKITESGKETIIRKIEAKFPGYAGAAALPARELLKMDIGFVAEQLQKNKNREENKNERK